MIKGKDLNQFFEECSGSFEGFEQDELRAAAQGAIYSICRNFKFAESGASDNNVFSIGVKVKFDRSEPQTVVTAVASSSRIQKSDLELLVERDDDTESVETGEDRIQTDLLSAHAS
jgi:hypothetical protein